MPYLLTPGVDNAKGSENHGGEGVYRAHKH